MAHGNLFTRPDTFFGVCEGLGEELHVPANLLRVAFAFLLFFNAKAAVAGYLAAGVVVFLARRLFPDRERRSADPAVVAQAPIETPVRGENDDALAPDAAAA